MARWLIWALLVAVCGRAEAWTPPRDPDPSKILHEAEADACAGRYEIALAKHLWFHRNALRYNQGLTGVRLSFALASWAKLAHDYPPAMAALRSERNRALADFRRREADAGFDSFHDFAGINRALDEEVLTAAAFKEAHAQSAERARWIFDVAMPALIKAKEYELCGHYLEPDEAWEQALAFYHLHVGFSRGRGRADDGFAKKHFTNTTATIIALLVVTGRKRDAMSIADEAREELADADFQAAIDCALRGEVPDPWP